MKDFSIVFPLENEFFTTVRLTTGGICSLAEFDVESTEDLKVCMTEGLLVLKRSGFSSARIDFCVGTPLSVKIVGQARDGEKETGLADEISFALLSALLGDVVYEKDGDGDVVALSFNA